jgi:hypothetical protein
MGCTYVKDFDFGPPKVQVKGYARGGPVKKEPGCACGGQVMKAKGGAVKDPATGIKYPSKAALAAHEAKETPAQQRYERRTGKEALPTRRSVPVAPKGPLIVIAMGKKGK